MALSTLKLIGTQVYIDIIRIYPYTVNVYKNFVQAIDEKNKINLVCTNIYFTPLYMSVFCKQSPYKKLF